MMAPPSSTAAANSQHPPQHTQPTTAVNNNFWASLHSVQDTCPVDWPLSVFPLAQQQFYQEFNQQRQQKKKARRQQPPQMQQQTTTNNTKGGGKDRRSGGNKIHPTAAGKQQPPAAPEMLPHSESLNFNLFGQHRKSGRSFSDQDLTKLGRETSTKSLNGGGGQELQQFVNAGGLICPCPDPQLGQSGGAVSSADSFISAYSYRRPSATQLAHSPNNSNGGGGTGSSQSTAPIYISNSAAAAASYPYQQQFHPFNRHTSPHPSPAGGGGGGPGAPNPHFPPYSISQLHKIHRGELSLNEKYRYDLSRAQLKASSRTSALLSGFAMIALVELQYMQDTPKPLLIMLGVVTTLLVSVHLLALMMSTCLLPYIEANGCTQDSPHIKLKFYIELSWIFSTCIGLLLFLLEIGVIFFVKFNAIGYNFAAYITTGMLIPVLIIFIVISYLIHRNRFTHSIERVNDKVVDLQKYLVEAEMGAANQQTSMGPHATNSIQRNMVSAGLQGVTVVRNFKD